MENNIQSVNAENVEVKEEQAAQKTYSEKEVMELLQRESDRRVSQALKKQSEKYEKQLSLSKLDGDEREKAEKDNRIAELEEKLVEFQTEKNKSELKSVLSARGLSAEFADIINISSDIEASQANIDKLDKLFKEAVKAEVEKRLANSGGTPRGGEEQIEALTAEKVKKMSLGELNKLKEENPELFADFFK